MTQDTARPAVPAQPQPRPTQAPAPAITATQAIASPAEVEVATVGTAERKAKLGFLPLIVLGVLAGAYISFGGELATLVTADAAKYVGDGLAKLAGGLVFSVGLVLVVVAGAELFTGNNLMISGVLTGRFGWTPLLRNWCLVYLANFGGSLLVVALMAASGLWEAGTAGVGVRAVTIAAGKLSLTWPQAIARGILCNWLVCLAVWMSFAMRDGVSKILACVLPVTAFVASGFEHSIANMYFIPAGWLAVRSPAVFAALANAVGPVQAATLASRFTCSSFLWANMIPVTIGNLIGGAVFVGTAYWLAYGRGLRRA